MFKKIGIEERTDSMNTFVKLLSTMEEKGFEVPLSSIHWVLGMNRQIELGKKIDIPIKEQVRNLLATRKLGLAADIYNEARVGKRKISDALGALARCLANQLRAEH